MDTEATTVATVLLAETIVESERSTETNWLTVADSDGKNSHKVLGDSIYRNDYIPG